MKNGGKIIAEQEGKATRYRRAALPTEEARIELKEAA